MEQVYLVSNIAVCALKWICLFLNLLGVFFLWFSDFSCGIHVFTFLKFLSGGIQSLVVLLDSKLEHVLVNCVNALRVLCDGSYDNQTAVAQSGAVDTLTELLSKKNLLSLGKLFVWIWSCMVDNIYHAAETGIWTRIQSEQSHVLCQDWIRNFCSQNDFVSFQNLVPCGSYQFFLGNGKVADLFCYWPAVTSTFKSQFYWKISKRGLLVDPLPNTPN